MNFFRKFFELQILMLQHNAGLTDSHPYASGPINWPFLLNGISFWTGAAETREQVYLIGNVVSWWICIMAVSVFVGVLAADQLSQRRGLEPIPRRESAHCLTDGVCRADEKLRYFAAVRNRLHNTGGFFLISWAYHYLPFFTMSRQLFLHHYLPAHLLSALVAGVVFSFLFCGDTVNYPVSIADVKTRRRPRTRAVVTKGMKLAFVIVNGLILAGFVFLAPLTYGTPGLSPGEVQARQVLSSWTLVSTSVTCSSRMDADPLASQHFAK